MVARYAGACLGLLAFSITTFTGLYVGNPVSVTLSRGILAMFLFFFIGLTLGWVAELVIGEYEKERQEQIRKKYDIGASETVRESAKPEEGEFEPGSTQDDGVAVGAA